MAKATSKKKAKTSAKASSKSSTSGAKKKAAGQSASSTQKGLKDSVASKTTAKKTASKKAAAKKASAKKTAAKQPAAKKTAAKKVVAKKASAKKVAAKKKTDSPAEEQVEKKTTAKQPAEKKTAAKKAASKNVAEKKTTAKKAASKKVAAKESKQATDENETEDSSSTKKSKKKTAAKASPSIPVGEPVVTTVVPYEREKNSHYMDKEQLEYFSQKLAEWKQQLMEEVDRTVGHMKDDATNFPDPNDRATQEEEFSLELRTRDRERKLIKKINEAVKRIEENEYGYCETCGVEIGVGRLEARPTAELCIDCKTLEEIREKQIA